MRNVMPAVPGIQREHTIERLQPGLGMIDLAREIGIAHGAENHDPPRVHAFQNRE